MLIEVVCHAPQGMDHGGCSRRMAEGHSWTTTSFTGVGKGGEEDGAQVVSRSSESPSATRSESITIVENSNASARGWAASLAGSRPSCVRGPVQGGEVGSRNHCSGRERQSGSPFERGVATRAFPGSGSTCGSAHHWDSGVHCTGPEACGGHAHRFGESTGGGCESARNTPTRGSTSSRWRGTSCYFAGGVSQSTPSQ